MQGYPKAIPTILLTATCLLGACASSTVDPVEAEKARIKTETAATDEARRTCKELGQTDSPTCIKRIIDARLGGGRTVTLPSWTDTRTW